jgi:hypothetical protein
MTSMTFSQEWRALNREAQLAGQQISTGVTALGHATHAELGLYTEAFFGLSIGLERLAKLIVVTDHAIHNSGTFPTNDDLRKTGHDILLLVSRCDVLSREYRAGKEYSERPNDSIHQGIIETLSEFAKLSRYYNLDLLVQGKSAHLLEPIQAWWQRVGEPILFRHYSNRQREKDKLEAEIGTALVSASSAVIHSNETGASINNIDELIRHGRATRVVQKYGCLYTLQVVRWMSFLISDLSHVGAYEKRIEPLLGIDEPFLMFRMDDKYLKTRLRWSIYPWR